MAKAGSTEKVVREIRRHTIGPLPFMRCNSFYNNILQLNR